jgi:hypothetical protein
MREVPNRAYRSIERGKSQLQGRIRTGQNLSAAIEVNRRSRRAPDEETYHLFCLYEANPGAAQLPQTGT